MKILIWGIGYSAEKILKDLKPDVEIVGYIDNNKEKQNQEFLGVKVFSPEYINTIEHDFLVVSTTLYAQEIYEQIELNKEYNSNKVILLGPFWDRKRYQNNFSNFLKIVNYSDDKYWDFSLRPNGANLIRTMQWDQSQESIIDNNELSSYYKSDYMRYRTFELVADEINDKNIKGEVAEVGVYRGDFAKLINVKFPNKKLYLFDTFSGFDENEYASDKSNKFVSETENNPFVDTTVELVLSKMSYQENCIVKKGFFPDTAQGLDENFAFVSIDVDLENAIFNSLEYFYTKLSKGGYIFIHEYNNSYYKGVKEAVKRFESKHGALKSVPIADFSGTLIVTK